MSDSRKDVLLKALEAEVGVASVDLGTLFTDDVVGWSPYREVSGLSALAELAALRELAFSNVALSFRGLDEVGNKAFAEWVIDADHTGPLVLDEDAVLEATGRHVQLPGVTVADFRDGKIRSYPDVLRRRLVDRADRRRLTDGRWSSRSRTIRIRAISDSSRRRSAVRRLPPWGSVRKPTWRSSFAKRGRIVAGVSGWTWGDSLRADRACGWTPTSGAAGWGHGSSPPPRRRRRREAARKPCTSPTPSRLGACTNGPATN